MIFGGRLTATRVITFVATHGVLEVNGEFNYSMYSYYIFGLWNEWRVGWLQLIEGIGGMHHASGGLFV